MLNFVLCDDNIDVLNSLGKMLEAIFIRQKIDAAIGFKAANGDELLKYLSNNYASVLIADIELNSKMSGIDVAQKIREQNKEIYIIFTSGHLEYIMLAYQVKTFDFLAKPITIERLEDTIVRLINDMESQPKKYVKLGNTNTLISQEEVNFIEKNGMKLVIHTDNRKYETYGSFAKIENYLADNFVRCHKSYIANVNRITDVAHSSNTIFFGSDSGCSIGPKYRMKFMEVVNNARIPNDTESRVS